MKYLRKFAVLLVICFGLVTVVAFTPLVSVIMNENLKITFNGKVFQPKDENGENLRPLTYNDRNYLPVRAFLEKAGVLVDYDDTNQTVILKSENTLLSRANLALHYLKYKDLEQLAKLVHPTKGVTFTPYAYISDTDMKFSASEIKKLTDNKLYNWGEFDGSGHPMNLSFSDYYDGFVYPVDFINAKIIGNNTIIQTGNNLNNLTEAYPDAKFIEYNFPGFDKEFEGMDWQSLRLVFEEVDNEWYLIGIVHDAWAI